MGWQGRMERVRGGGIEPPMVLHHSRAGHDTLGQFGVHTPLCITYTTTPGPCHTETQWRPRHILQGSSQALLPSKAAVFPAHSFTVPLSLDTQ